MLTAMFRFVDKALKETLDKILLSSYFDQTQTHQNGVCEEEEEEQQQQQQAPPQQQQPPAPVESAECEEQPAEPGMKRRRVRVTVMESCTGDDGCFCVTEGSVTQEFAEPIEVEATEVCIDISY